MTNNNNSDTRAVRTTILTIDRKAIDWDLLCQNCHIVRYVMPFKQKYDKYYYPRMHIWYKQTSDLPCYLHIHGPHLYVKHGHPDEVMALSYQGQPLSSSVVNLQDENMLPQMLKLLVADFFQVDGRFVSNADFFLWATAEKDFITGLKIQLTHNWQENNDEFVISDEAGRLSKLEPSDFEKMNDWKHKNEVYYGRFYIEDMAVFKQLKPDQLTRVQMKEGIYKLFEGSLSNRASLTFHSVKSLNAFQQTRSYLLNQFINRFVAYLNKLGLPFQQKLLQMQAMHTKSITEMQRRQLPIEEKPIYIVDDRLNTSRKSDDFAAHFCEVANAATTDQDVLFKVKAEVDLQPGDWVLRIQDYEGDEFDPEKGILKDWQDTKNAFYARHPAVVKQTRNVNHSNSKRRRAEAQRNKARTWSADEYLDYPMPSVKDIETLLEVCRNQLFLKDAIMFPENVCSRLPQVGMMTGMIFLDQQALAYFDGLNLQFMSVANNLDAVSSFIQTHTGWDLITDILLPSAERYYYDHTARSTAIVDTTKRPFIISRDFVWEIAEGNGRVVHEDDIIQRRLETLEEAIPTKRFYPPQPIQENQLFTTAQLQAYEQFLDQHVREATISYRDLKKQYGTDIKDDRGEILVKDLGFFGLLGIKKESKFKRYLNEYLGLTFESVREDHLFPVYKGIWYSSATNHYVAGVKDANPEEQERGHALRRIIVHQGDRDPDRLQAQLVQSFFPLLYLNQDENRSFARDELN